MDKSPDRRRFLVITPNVIVGEDLREVMLARENTEVDLFASLKSAWQTPYDLAVFGCPIQDVLSDRRIRALQKSGTRVVLLDDHLPSETLKDLAVDTLVHPFATEDVEALIREVDSGANRKA